MPMVSTNLKAAAEAGELPFVLGVMGFAFGRAEPAPITELRHCVGSEASGLLPAGVRPPCSIRTGLCYVRR